MSIQDIGIGVYRIQVYEYTGYRYRSIQDTGIGGYRIHV